MMFASLLRYVVQFLYNEWGFVWMLTHGNQPLIHWGRMTHIYVSKLGHHWFRWWLVACSAPRHYLNLSRFISKDDVFLISFQWNFNLKMKQFSLNKINYKISSAAWQQSCIGRNVMEREELKTWTALVAGHQQEPLQWRHNEHDGVSYHQPYDCLLNRLLKTQLKETSKLRVTSVCAWNSPGPGEFPAQMASNAENVSIWWRHHGIPVGEIDFQIV